ncbi:MAG: hypothetical protein ACPGES_05530, partial [Coraliomargarita sp.]
SAPMTIADAVLPPVPDAQNAAPLYLELEQLIESTPAIAEAKALIENDIFQNGDAKDWEHILRMELSDSEWVVLENAIQELDAVGYFDLVDQIVRRQHFRPDWDYNLGPAMLIPEVGQSRDANRYKLARASLALRTKQSPSTALKELSGAYRISEHMAEGQNLISVLTACALRGTNYENLESLSRNTNHILELDPAIWEFSILDYWVPSLDLERLSMGVVVFEGLLYGNGDLEAIFGSGDSRLQKFGKMGLIRWFFEYDYATYLNLMADMREQALLPPTEMENLKAEQEAAFADIKKNYRILTSILLPAVATVQTHLHNTEARDSLAETGLALTAYHSAQGTYPATLEALIPDFMDAIPMDPFSTGPMVYKKMDDGYALYSVGPDLIDNNGTEDRNDRHEGDLIWTGFGSKLERIYEEW